MLTAIFPDSYATLNKIEHLLCTKRRIVDLLCHFKILSRTRNYNNSSIINKNKFIQGRLRTPLPDTVIGRLRTLMSEVSPTEFF